MVHFLKDLLDKRFMLFDLVFNDFKSRYLSSYLGVFWAFVQPTITITIFWFVFEVGFKSAPVENFPFILWLISGMIPWFFVAESIVTTASAIIDNEFLVKKIFFKVEYLPVVKIVSAFIVHLFYLVFMMCIFLYYGYCPNIFWLQIIYYLICSTLFVLGIGWVTSSLVVFFRDINQLVQILVQFWFWATPIFWSLAVVPAEYLLYFELNPIYYIVQGYRDTMIYKVWFWEKPIQAFQFWLISVFVLYLGSNMFRRLRPHFADVL